MAPEARLVSAPRSNRTRVGILRIANRLATPGRRSVSTLAISTRPAFCPASRSSSGATMRHGPHHSAQKSTTTGHGASRTSASKSASASTWIGAAGGDRACLQRPHLGCRSSLPNGTRFSAPQCSHLDTICLRPQLAPVLFSSRGLLEGALPHIDKSEHMERKGPAPHGARATAPREGGELCRALHREWPDAQRREKGVKKRTTLVNNQPLFPHRPTPHLGGSRQRSTWLARGSRHVRVRPGSARNSR